MPPSSWEIFGHGVIGGVLETGIEVPAGLQVKELPHVLGSGVLEGGGLDDGNLAGLAVSGCVTPLDADGFRTVIAHTYAPFRCLERKNSSRPKEISFETKAATASAVPLKLRRPHGPAPLSESSNSFALTQRARGALRRKAPSNSRLRSHRTWGPFPPAHTTRRLSEVPCPRPSPSSLWAIL